MYMCATLSSSYSVGTNDRGSIQLQRDYDFCYMYAGSIKSIILLIDSKLLTNAVDTYIQFSKTKISKMLHFMPIFGISIDNASK